MCPVVALAWAEYRLHTTASVVVAFRSRGCLLCIERVLGRLEMQYRVARVCSSRSELVVCTLRMDMRECAGDL
jgi:hypothetical protein